MIAFDYYQDKAPGTPAPPPWVVIGVFRYRATPAGPAGWEKRCPGCLQWKPETEFWWQSARTTRRHRKSRCSLCFRLASCAEFE